VLAWAPVILAVGAFGYLTYKLLSRPLIAPPNIAIDPKTRKSTASFLQKLWYTHSQEILNLSADWRRISYNAYRLWPPIAAAIAGSLVFLNQMHCNLFGLPLRR